MRVDQLFFTAPHQQCNVLIECHRQSRLQKRQIHSKFMSGIESTRKTQTA